MVMNPLRGMTPLPLANSYLIQKQGCFCPAASKASDSDHSAGLISDRQHTNHNSCTIHRLLSQVVGCFEGLSVDLGSWIMSVINKMVLTLLKSKCVYSKSPLTSQRDQLESQTICLMHQWQKHVWVWYHQPWYRQLAARYIETYSKRSESINPTICSAHINISCLLYEVL